MMSMKYSLEIKLKYFLVIASLLSFFHIRGQDDLTFLLNSKFSLTTKGIKVEIPIIGDANVNIPKPDEAKVLLVGQAKLNNLESNLLPILKRSLDYYDECGDRLSVNGAKFGSFYNGSAIAEINFRFEKWICERILWDDLKTRLLSQSGSVFAKITPEISGRVIHFQTHIIDVNADGILGSLLEENSSLREEIIELLNHELPQGIQAPVFKELDNIQTLEPRSINFIPGPSLEFKIFMEDELSILTGNIFKYLTP